MGIEDVFAFLGEPEVQITIKITKAFIELLRKSFAEDVQRNLKRDLADSELKAAKDVIDSLALESEKNWKHGINRAITHLESAFTIYTQANEFSSSCVCAAYLSCLHGSVGNSNPKLHVRIWEQIPLLSVEDIEFGKYCSFARRFIPEKNYLELYSARKERYSKILNVKLDFLRKQLLTAALIPQAGRSVYTASIRFQIETLEAQQRKLQNLGDARSDWKRIWDIAKPWWLG